MVRDAVNGGKLVKYGQGRVWWVSTAVPMLHLNMAKPPSMAFNAQRRKGFTMFWAKFGRMLAGFQAPGRILEARNVKRGNGLCLLAADHAGDFSPQIRSSVRAPPGRGGFTPGLERGRPAVASPAPGPVRGYTHSAFL